MEKELEQSALNRVIPVSEQVSLGWVKLIEGKAKCRKCKKELTSSEIERYKDDAEIAICDNYEMDNYSFHLQSHDF